MNLWLISVMGADLVEKQDIQVGTSNPKYGCVWSVLANVEVNSIKTLQMCYRCSDKLWPHLGFKLTIVDLRYADLFAAPQNV